MAFSDISRIIESATFSFLSLKSERNEQNHIVDFKFIEANDAFYTLFGLHESEIVDKKYSEICNSLRLTVLGDKTLLYENVNSHSTGEYEFFFAPKNKWIRLHYHFSSNVEKNDFHVIFYDVTSSKRHKIETESFFNFSFDMLLIFNPEGFVLKANDAWSVICQYSPSELENKNFLMWVHPEDKDNTEKAFEFLREVGVLDSFLLRFRCKNGEFISLQLRAKFHDNNIYASFRDVSEQLKREAEVRASEEQFRLLSENTTDVIWTMNLEGEFTYVSPSVQKMRGYTAEEVLKQKPHEVLCPCSINALENGLRLIEQNRVKGEPIPQLNYILEQPCKDGTTVWTETIINGLVNSSDETIGIIGVSRNIQDRKITEDALRESEEKLRVMFDAANIGISIVDLNGKYQTFNSWWEHFLGYTSQELKTKTNIDLTHPLDILESKILFDKALKGEINNYRIEKRYLRKDGGVVWGDASVSVIRNANGEITNLVGMVLDINQKKLNEIEKEYQLRFQELVSEISNEFLKVCEQDFDAKIQNMLQRIGEFYKVDRSYVFSVSPDFNYISNTYEWCDEGISPEIHSNQLLDLSSMPWWSNQLQNKQIIFIRDVDSLPTEASIEKADFLRQNIQALLCVPIVIDNKTIGFLGFDSVKEKRNWSEKDGALLQILANILADAQQKVTSEIELIKSKEEALKASKAKSVFLANMSHEIRTPLNGVIGFTELLLNTELSEKQIEYAKNATLSGHTLLGIINDILDLSKIESGKLELEVLETNVYELIERTVDIMKYQAHKKGLEFLLFIDPSVPVYAFIDSVRLNQIIINLLSNAIKFTHHGEVELRVEFQKDKEQEGVFSFYVRDTGIGIKPENQGNLFKAFNQAETNITRQFGGTGLGLIISSMLAQKMGGKIEFVSEYNKGSEFFFHIKTKFLNKERLYEHDFKDIKRILIVDDNKNNRTILSQTLKAWKINTSSCSNPMEAYELLKSGEKFDVVLLDYKMPVMNGLQAVELFKRELYEQTKNLTFALIHSSEDDITIHDECKRLGVKYHFLKPLKSRDLLQFLRSIVNKEPASNRLEIPKSKQIDVISSDIAPIILIAEDVAMNMMLIKVMLKKLLPKAIILEAINGEEAQKIWKLNQPDILFMDVQMPIVDGIEATKYIRKHESKYKSKIIAFTAGATREEEKKCIEAGMNDFLAKPVSTENLRAILEKHLEINEAMLIS